MKKLKTDDSVIVISGKHKGKTSTIAKMKDIKDKRWMIRTFVWLQWVNVAKKAVKGEWFKDIELPIHISNVKYYSEQDKKATKIKIIEKDWKKKRLLVAVDRTID